MFRQTPALLHARGRSVVVIVLLLVSVIGAPFAFRAMVRWFFAEHEVLLQGTPANEALARSATLVDTSRWRTLGIVLFLGALGGLMAPVTSFVLVVLTPLPLWLVNVISFGVYSAVLPFVAVTLTFLYWDLVARFDRSAINSTR